MVGVDVAILLKHSEKIRIPFAARGASLETQARISVIGNSYFKFEYENRKLGKWVCRSYQQLNPELQKMLVFGMVDAEAGVTALNVNNHKDEIAYHSQDYPASTLISSEKTAKFLTETHRTIVDSQKLVDQCKPYLFSTDYEYVKYAENISNIKTMLSDALSTICGLRKRIESIGNDPRASGHNSTIMDLLANIETLLRANVSVAQELESTTDVNKYTNLQFERDSKLLGNQIFVILNKAVADERYFRMKLGPLFWGD